MMRLLFYEYLFEWYAYKQSACRFYVHLEAIYSQCTYTYHIALLLLYTQDATKIRKILNGLEQKRFNVGLTVLLPTTSTKKTKNA